MSQTALAEQARAVVYDAYRQGLPQATAAQLLAGKATPAWIAHEYAALRRRGISQMAGQQELFAPEPADAQQ
ncbi:hypothetical protein OS965_34565 [Streptomyces sp. H27-G5]|uniref:hypothetical protein n=1 Tax=Streptomyces sp. H27-G5 TaxID=2996698 RepID=UPI002271C157|nr:hypothetical protein [Streptomyces sp. H27-G5]MCY0923203.1 hypothetical protein [Streptomyces sp. H27-G5]